MERKELEDTIKRLRAELAAGQPLGESDRELLEGILAEAAAVLEPGSKSAGLTARLRDAALRFEGSHPELTQAIGAVADVLSRMGI